MRSRSFISLAHVAVFLLGIALAKVAAAVDVEVGRMIMQLRSSVDADGALLQSKLQTVTTDYLHQYFATYYSTTSDLPGYFSQANLVVGSFGVYGVEGSFISTLELAGTLTFGYDPPPSPSFVDTLLRNAFQGHNEKIFIGHLLSSDFEFLQELTHIIIEVDNSAVVETALQGNQDDVESESNPDASPSTNSDDNSGDTQASKVRWPVQKKWAEILLYIAAGVGGLLLFVCFYYIFRCCCCDKTSVVTDKEEEPMKIVEIPMTKTWESEESEMDERRMSLKYASNSRRHKRGSKRASTQRRLAYPPHHYDDSLLDQLERAPPSPGRSIASQDSSKFTYTDNMSMSKASVGSISRYSMDMPSIDLGTWQKPNTIPSGNDPFGHDISAIGKRDLSLIQEESNEEDGLHVRRDSKGSGSRQSPKVLADDDGYSSSRHSRKSRHSYGSKQSRRGYRGDPQFTDTSSETNDSSDVIADLRNLSIQITREREARRSGR